MGGFNLRINTVRSALHNVATATDLRSIRYHKLGCADHFDISSNTYRDISWRAAALESLPVHR